MRFCRLLIYKIRTPNLSSSLHLFSWIIHNSSRICIRLYLLWLLFLNLVVVIISDLFVLLLFSWLSLIRYYVFIVGLFWQFICKLRSLWGLSLNGVSCPKNSGYWLILVTAHLILFMNNIILYLILSKIINNFD